MRWFHYSNMIAIQENLETQKAWQLRVVKCGDALSKARAKQRLAEIEVEEIAINGDIAYYLRKRNKYVLRVLAVVGLVTLALFACIHT
jgi:hypothetical protein